MPRATETAALIDSSAMDTMANSSQEGGRNDGLYISALQQGEHGNSHYSSHNPSPRTPITPETSVNAGTGTGTTEGGSTQGRWLDRILLKLKLRKQFTEVAWDGQPQKLGLRKRISARLKRGLFRKEKKNTGKSVARNEPTIGQDDLLETFPESSSGQQRLVPTARGRLPVVSEYSPPLGGPSQGNPQNLTLEYETGIDRHSSSLRQQNPLEAMGNQQPLVGKRESSTSQNPRQQEQLQGQKWQQKQTSEAINELYEASFEPKHSLNMRMDQGGNQVGRSSLFEPRNEDMVGVLGKNGGIGNRLRSVAMQPQRHSTAGWIASLPSSTSINSQESLYPTGGPRESNGSEAFHHQLQRQPSFTVHNSGGLVRQSPSTHHLLSSSRHPIADAHAEEWRRRTVGGFPIPERYSSRWRPRSRCPSARRCASIDSRQTAYNPYDLPRIPRQPLFNDLVDLLSLSRMVNLGHNGSDAHLPATTNTTSNGINTNTNYTTHPNNNTVQTNTAGDRLDSFDSTVSTNPGLETTSSTLIDRRASAGSRLAPQISSSGGGSSSTITNTTTATIPPLFQEQLPPAAVAAHNADPAGAGLGFFNGESFMPVDEERKSPHELFVQTGTPMGGGLTKQNAQLTPPPMNKAPFTFGTPPQPSGPLMMSGSGSGVGGTPPSAQSGSGSGSGSGDSSVPEAWWTNQEGQGNPYGAAAGYGHGYGHGHVQGPVPYGYGYTIGGGAGPGGRPSTPSSPMTRRMEKWSKRRKRGIEGR